MFENAIKYLIAFIFLASVLSVNKFLIILGHLLSKISKTKKNKIPDFHDLAAEYGYGSENHLVITEDGYVLTLHRLMETPEPPKVTKPLVLLVHGVFSSSEIWVQRGRNHDLALMLVDKGYDVWLFNARGNFYSRKHLSLDPDKDKKFWLFCTDEIGQYDLSATVDFILTKTGLKKLSLVSFSMGSLASCVMLSHKPEYNQKINLNIIYGETVTMAPSYISYLQLLCNSYYKEFRIIAAFFGKYEALPASPSFHVLSDILLQHPNLNKIFQKMMLPSLRIVATRKYNLMEPSFLGQLFKHWPHGTSLDALVHQQDMIMTERVHQCDYGPEENLKRYGSSESPDYPLRRITTPIIIFSGLNDGFSTEVVRERLLRTLPNAKEKVIDDELFHHIDYIYHPRCKELLFDDTIAFLDEYNQKKEN